MSFSCSSKMKQKRFHYTQKIIFHVNHHILPSCHEYAKPFETIFTNFGIEILCLIHVSKKITT